GGPDRQREQRAARLRRRQAVGKGRDGVAYPRVAAMAAQDYQAGAFEQRPRVVRQRVRPHPIARQAPVDRGEDRAGTGKSLPEIPILAGCERSVETAEFCEGRVAYQAAMCEERI